MAIEELTVALSQIISVAKIDVKVTTGKSLPPTQLFIGENGIFHSDSTIA